MERWQKLMEDQAGLVTTLDGADIEVKPKTVFSSSVDFDENISFAFQIPTACFFTLYMGEEAFDCSILEAPEQKHATRHAYHVATRKAIRHVVKVGSYPHVALHVSWLDTKNKEHTQVIMDGSFCVPSKLEKLGAPGFVVHIPHLQTLSHFSVANILVGKNAQMEFINFFLTLLV